MTGGKGEDTVLVVNDKPDLAELMSLQLRKSGYRVLTAFDGREGFEVAQAELPDLIISDVSMPSVDGIELCRLIRAHPRLQTTPMLLVSAVRRDSESVVEGLRAGADDYLEMPYDKTHLITKVAQLIERKLAEDRLLESERRFRQLAESINEVFWIVDPDERAMLYVSPAYEEIWGRTCESLYESSLSYLEAVHPDDQKKIVAATVRQSRGERTDEEYRIVRPDGSTRWIHDRAFPIKGEGGRVSRVVGVAEDITERKRAEESLQESEERYRLLFESNPQPMWVYDLETLRFLAVNEAAVQHYGYTREEFLAMTLKDIRPPEEVPALMQTLAAPVAGLDKAGIWRHRRKDGSVIDVEITSHHLTFAGRRTELVLAHDVTERTKAAVALMEAEEKYRSIFENAVEGIFQSTAAGRWISANPAMAHMLGYESPQELMASVTDIERQVYVEPDSRAEYGRLLEEHGVVRGFVTRLRRKDGSRIWASVNTRAVRDANGRLVYYEGSVEDITERKQLEEQLQQSQKMEAVGKLAGGIAHDFNNLLTVIGGYTELLLMQMDPDNPLSQTIEEIRKASDRAASLTRQLLAFSRKQVLQPEVIDLNTTVIEIEKMVRRLIGEDVELITALCLDATRINADPGQIEQVLMNLVVNARDAMPQGGKLMIKTEKVELTEEYAGQHIAVRPGRYVMLAISDTGTGMDAETQKHIFEPFFTTKEMGKGTGLGLSTVYGIIKQSGGHLWVYSEVGQGTTFKIYLPLVEEEAESIQPRATNAAPPRGTETVLLVEDEEMVRRMARGVLEMNGYTVIEAAHGREALSICERHHGPLHLLLTDVVMPRMSGRELAQAIATLHPEMRVLYMSGYTDDAILHHGVLDPGTALLEKPFTPSALARKVREVLDR